MKSSFNPPYWTFVNAYSTRWSAEHAWMSLLAGEAFALFPCFLFVCLIFFSFNHFKPLRQIFLSQFFFTASPACLHVTEQSLFSIKNCWASYTARGRCKRYYQGGCRAIICPLPLTLVLASHLRGGEAHRNTASFPPIFLRQVCPKGQS